MFEIWLEKYRKFANISRGLCKILPTPHPPPAGYIQVRVIYSYFYTGTNCIQVSVYRIRVASSKFNAWSAFALLLSKHNIKCRRSMYGLNSWKETWEAPDWGHRGVKPWENRLNQTGEVQLASVCSGETSPYKVGSKFCCEFLSLA